MLLLLLSVHARAQTSGHARDLASLPNAPEPVPSAANPQQSTQAAPQYRLKIAPRFTRDLNADQEGPRLSPGDKIRLSFVQQVTLYAFTTQLLSAGWEHLLNTDPKYGTDSAGFGEQLGAAALRQTSQSFFNAGLFASLFHQDPRYYRMQNGPFMRRIGYAASRTWVTRMDSGREAPNYSLWAGYGAASALTLTYYPAVSATGPNTAKGYAISLGVSMLGNQYHEFGPDVYCFLFHRHCAGGHATGP